MNISKALIHSCGDDDVYLENITTRVSQNLHKNADQPKA
jgi:hypothetical protein